MRSWVKSEEVGQISVVKIACLSQIFCSPNISSYCLTASRAKVDEKRPLGLSVAEHFDELNVHQEWPQGAAGCELKVD